MEGQKKAALEMLQRLLSSLELAAGLPKSLGDQSHLTKQCAQFTLSSGEGQKQPWMRSPSKLVEVLLLT